MTEEQYLDSEEKAFLATSTPKNKPGHKMKNLIIGILAFLALGIITDELGLGGGSDKRTTSTTSTTNTSYSESEYRNLNATMNRVMADDKAVKGWRLDYGTLYITIKVNSPQYGFAHYGFDSSYAKHFTSNQLVNRVVFQSNF